MLRINRLRVEIQTQENLYGFDETFTSGLNFLASSDNTCGKSSIIEAIYYCLGFEEIIGGKGEKVLTSVYKSYIEIDKKELLVLEAKAYLEISNGSEVVTLYRSAKSINDRDTRLITVYYSEYDKISEGVTADDYYVNMTNSAINNKGFHNYLEKFLHLEIPKVPATDGNQRKLYLQLLFSCMFIEQKHGWSDIFSGMPYLGIKDAKKRVIEFILNLDTLNIERKKDYLLHEEYSIKNKWTILVKEIYNASQIEGCEIIGLPLKPCILDEKNISKIYLSKNQKNIDNFIIGLKEKYEGLESLKPKIIDNFDKLLEELDITEQTVEKNRKEIKSLYTYLMHEKDAISSLNENIELIENDLRNNKDAARLRKLGSEQGCSTANNVCPTCHQPIQDSLLPLIEESKIMSIDENIRHLEAQKEMLHFSKDSRVQKCNNIQQTIQDLRNDTFQLSRLAKVLRDDLYSVDDNISESLIYKKIETEIQIERLENLNNYINNKIKCLIELSDAWNIYLSEKSKIPKNKFTEKDSEKISHLRNVFVENLSNYGYKSITNIQDVNISTENYLPVIKEFDMKFDSSASDNIRGIWAYTVALLQVSMSKHGNHPLVLIFDEPIQHSIIPKDMQNFFNSILKLGNNCQIIIGITIKDIDTKKTIEGLGKDKYNLIKVKNKAFQKLEDEQNVIEE